MTHKRSLVLGQGFRELEMCHCLSPQQPGGAECNMAVASIYGVICRLVWLSSLAFGDTHQITVLLSTPRFAAPSNIGLCFTSHEYSQSAQTVAVTSIKSADSLFDDWRASSNSGFQGPVEVGSPRDLLNSDSSYASSFSVDKWVPSVAS